MLGWAACGMALRAADPASMKEFIISIQERTAELKSVLSKKTDGNSTIIGKRLQFMLDMICDIKNNKRRPKDELVVHSRLKKWLQKVILSAQLVAQSGFWFALKGYMSDLA
jgi:nucleolar MIF4G domain-containing protein 1